MGTHFLWVFRRKLDDFTIFFTIFVKWDPFLGIFDINETKDLLWKTNPFPQHIPVYLNLWVTPPRLGPHSPVLMIDTVPHCSMWSFHRCSKMTQRIFCPIYKKTVPLKTFDMESEQWRSNNYSVSRKLQTVIQHKLNWEVPLYFDVNTPPHQGNSNDDIMEQCPFWPELILGRIMMLYNEVNLGCYMLLYIIIRVLLAMMYVFSSKYWGNSQFD